MKFIYFYNNNSTCEINNFDEWDLLEGRVKENYIEHSIEVNNNTINREKGNNKYLHIFKEHKDGHGNSVWKWYASYCI